MPQTFNMTKIRINKIVVEDITTHGRKIRIAKIRDKMLEHLRYIRLKTDTNFQNLARDEIINELKCFGELPNNESLSNDTLVNKFWHLKFWHDGSTLANHSQLL